MKRDVSVPVLPLFRIGFIARPALFLMVTIMPKCLVCSKEVMPDTPGLAGVHKGETIYFCSNVCKAEFKKYANMRETSSSPPR
jgi:YHS domain-containing protein